MAAGRRRSQIAAESDMTPGKEKPKPDTTVAPNCRAKMVRRVERRRRQFRLTLILRVPSILRVIEGGEETFVTDDFDTLLEKDSSEYNATKNICLDQLSLDKVKAQIPPVPRLYHFKCRCLFNTYSITTDAALACAVSSWLQDYLETCTDTIHLELMEGKSDCFLQL